jgi:glutathione peroxidase-family protein
MKSLITFFAGLFLASYHVATRWIPLRHPGQGYRGKRNIPGPLQGQGDVDRECCFPLRADPPIRRPWKPYTRNTRTQGLVVLGFPCNQFGGQEPGSNEEIASFCKKNYGVSFPLFDKIEVNGTERHPLYTELAGDHSPYPGSIKWNFTKFLVGRDGTILKRFEPRVSPDAEPVVSAVTAALAE